MKIITTVITLPPELTKVFDGFLLTKATPYKTEDDSDALWEVYVYIKHFLMKKANHDPKSLEKCQNLEKEFLELYVRAIAKEKDKEKQNQNKTQEPFYRIEGFGRSHEKIFRGLWYTKAKASKYREDYEIPKV